VTTVTEKNHKKHLQIKQSPGKLHPFAGCCLVYCRPSGPKTQSSRLLVV